jgi:hypothetical protein
MVSVSLVFTSFCALASITQKILSRRKPFLHGIIWQKVLFTDTIMPPMGEKAI